MYVAKPSREATPLVDAAGPQELILHFVSDVGVDDLKKAFVEAFERNGADKVTSMNRRGAMMTDQEMATIVEYLSKYFGPSSDSVAK